MRLHPKDVKHIVIHCSDSPNNKDFTAEDIHDWHQAQGWDGIGYHKVIQRSGDIQSGRPLYWRGAHVRGHNHQSVGICLIGRDEFTETQWSRLATEIEKLLLKFPNAKVIGHRDLDPTKTCPNFDAGDWWDSL